MRRPQATSPSARTTSATLLRSLAYTNRLSPERSIRTPDVESLQPRPNGFASLPRHMGISQMYLRRVSAAGERRRWAYWFLI